MTVRGLDHVNIRTERLPETLKFYSEVLGMRCSPRPGADGVAQGAWIYDSEDKPIIHVGDAKAYPKEMRPAAGASQGSGSVDHLALACQDYEAVVARLKAMKLEIRTNEMAEMSIRQAFVRDPNGILLELNFRSAAA